jgi:hypothetical protein
MNGENIVDLAVVRKLTNGKLEKVFDECAERLAFTLIMDLFGEYERIGVEPPNIEFIAMKERWMGIIKSKMEVVL